MTWLRSNPFPVPGKFKQIQPTLFTTKDGRVVALMRSDGPRKVCRAESKDGGKTFSPAEETALPNPSSGIDAVKTRAGDVFLIYNPTPIARTPISLARSTDDGATWTKVVDLEAEAGEFSYPAMIESAAGKLEITYTWRRTHIFHRSVDPGKVTRTQACRPGLCCHGPSALKPMVRWLKARHNIARGDSPGLIGQNNSHTGRPG